MTARTDVTTERSRGRGPSRRAPHQPAGARQLFPAAAARSVAPTDRPVAPRPVLPAARPVAPPPARAPRPAGYRGPVRASRTRFVFLVVGLLGGALLSLLVINTILATGSFEISALRQGNVTLSQREQVLHAKIAAEESPYSIAQQAKKLGMIEPGLIHFLNLRTGRINGAPSRMPGVPVVGGYTP